MKITVLVVDDSSQMRQLLSFTLKDAGYDVVSAVNGNDALNKLTEMHIDIVVADLNMPWMDGISHVKELRRSETTKHTPIIMICTADHEDEKAEGKRAGADGCLVKPFTPQQLLEVVRQFVP